MKNLDDAGILGVVSLVITNALFIALAMFAASHPSLP